MGKIQLVLKKTDFEVVKWIEMAPYMAQLCGFKVMVMIF
jgi:hypothetical protein